MAKRYYSVRTGKNPLAGGFDLDAMRSMFETVFLYFDSEGYFQEALGLECVDAGFIPGTVGYDLAGALLMALRKRGLTPIREKIKVYTEEDLFDMIEFLYDHCSQPTERNYHSWNDCGWHCSKFDRDAGRVEYRRRINELLEAYENGYELSAEGEILGLVDDGLSPLLETPLPTSEADNVAARVEAAKVKFRRYRSSMDDRRDAIRDLADVLEYLRPQLKTVFTKKDEAAIFEIANNFGIRHHRAGEKTEYDKVIWFSWMFHYYLATIHAAVRLIEREANAAGQTAAAPLRVSRRK